MRSWLAPVLAAAAVAFPAGAHATYSIVATDGTTRMVGGSGTSCVGSLDVRIIIGVAPSFGAVHAQAAANTQGRDQAVVMLMQGASPDEIIAAITDQGFDFQSASRQYGVVDLMGRAAGWTGSTNGVYANDVQGTDGAYTYSVQGNILTSQAVIDNAEGAFVNGGGCDLPDRLMLALEAGAQNGEGDSRCTGGGIPSDSGFIQVVDEDGAEVINISVTNTGPESPLISLRSMYDAWRAQNPCADDGGTGTGSGTDTGTGSGGTMTGDDGGGDGSGSGEDGGGGGTDSTGPGADDGGDGDDGGVGTGSGADDGKGCGCAAGRGALPLLVLFGLPFVRRRRSAAR